MFISHTPEAFLVSIHAPREGCDSSAVAYAWFIWEFQFTHPGRGATSLAVEISSFQSGFQFTHPGRGATKFCQRRHSELERSFNSRTPGGVRH